MPSLAQHPVHRPSPNHQPVPCLPGSRHSQPRFWQAVDVATRCLLPWLHGWGIAWSCRMVYLRLVWLRSLHLCVRGLGRFDLSFFSWGELFLSFFLWGELILSFFPWGELFLSFFLWGELILSFFPWGELILSFFPWGELMLYTFPLLMKTYFLVLLLMKTSFLGLSCPIHRPRRLLLHLRRGTRRSDRWFLATNHGSRRTPIDGNGTEQPRRHKAIDTFAFHGVFVTRWLF